MSAWPYTPRFSPMAHLRQSRSATPETPPLNGTHAMPRQRPMPGQRPRPRRRRRPRPAPGQRPVPKPRQRRAATSPQTRTTPRVAAVRAWTPGTRAHAATRRAAQRGGPVDIDPDLPRRVLGDIGGNRSSISAAARQPCVDHQFGQHSSTHSAPDLNARQARMRSAQSNPLGVTSTDRPARHRMPRRPKGRGIRPPQGWSRCSGRCRGSRVSTQRRGVRPLSRPSAPPVRGGARRAASGPGCATSAFPPQEAAAPAPGRCGGGGTAPRARPCARRR